MHMADKMCGMIVFNKTSYLIDAALLEVIDHKCDSMK